LSDINIFDYEDALSRALDDKDLLNELIQELIKTIPENIESLEKFYQSKSVEDFLRTAHTMKGACSNLGAKSLAKTFNLIENIAKENNFTQYVPLKNQLIQDFDAFKNYVANM